nr:DinB family protein [Deinococcus arboris]
MLDRLLGHDAWTTWTLLSRSRDLTEEQLDQPHDLGWRTVRATLRHITENMETWTNLMTGVPPAAWPPAEGDSLDDLDRRLRAVAPRLAALARQIEAEGRLDDTWLDVLDRPPRPKTYGGAIAHVLTHSMHHRAQLIQMLRALGLPSVPEGDLLGWEMRGAPALPLPDPPSSQP